MKMDFPKDSPIWLDDSSDGQVAPLEKSKGTKEHKTQAPSIEKELRRLILVLKNRELYPCIVFSFSRRECEAYAQFIACPQKKKQKSDEKDDLIDLNSEEEKAAVQSIFDAALQCLDE
jgi:ATP-dependent RNA helicase DOB1